jgi:hypothetical protein
MHSALASGGLARWPAATHPFGIICPEDVPPRSPGDSRGGLLEVERAAVREHWLAGVGVVRLLVRGQEGRQPAEIDDETHNI